MFGYEEIRLHLSYPSIYFFIALILIGLYSYYVYRFTIPQVSRAKKIILVSLRTAALLILLFIFFEPILSLTKKIILDPVNLIFIDNSRSMKIDDGTNRTAKVKNISEDIFNNMPGTQNEVYLFGSKVRTLSEDSLENLNFNDAVTNISQIFSGIKKEDKNYSSIVLITDGDVTSGSNSIYAAKNMGLPVFTIGIGDTTRRKDVEIKRVLYNSLLYVEYPTTIEATIQHNGLSGKSVTVSLYEGNELKEQKNIILNNTGIQNISLDYTPESPGEKKLIISASPLEEEFTKENNRSVFYINILSNKVRVMILAGSPSTDLTFIRTAMESDNNLRVKSFIQINKDQSEGKESVGFIDSADVFFLIGFPSTESSSDLVNKVAVRITKDKIPFFILVSNSTNANSLNNFQSSLPFTVRTESGPSREVQPQVFENQKDNPIIQNDATNIIDAWNNLPPVFQPSFVFISKPESNVIAKIRINNNVLNSPLILSRNFNGSRSIAVLANGIWKWKLQTVRKKYNLFDKFILNSVKWLNTSDENKQVKIETSKKNYSLGEEVEFKGQVYDESLNPVSDAEVQLNITSGNERYGLNLSSVGNGLYEGSIRIDKKGDFNYTGRASLNGKTLGTDKGIFNVGDLDIEMLNPRMNYEYLNLLANETKGKYFDETNYKQALTEIEKVNENSKKEKIITSEINLWSDEWLIIIAIFLFSLEWFLRKRAGML
ncbi:hypothetical protein LJE86_05190 [bacterium BMS3Abin03]|nr:hypothetical protein [bacterium BMS3Abin03]